MRRPYSTTPASADESHSKRAPGVMSATRELEPPFSLDQTARAEWDRIIAEAPWLTETDTGAVADRCVCFSRLLLAERDISNRGHVIQTRNGKVLNPSIRVARTYRAALMKHGSELGFTPSSRKRIPDLPPGDGIDVLEMKLCGDWPMDS